jgi:predicted MFS family arabinose efflux permease
MESSRAAPAAQSLQAPARGNGSAAVIIAALLGEYSLLIMPFIVTAMMQGYVLSEASAGSMVSLQLGAMGVAGIAVSYLLARVSAHKIVLCAAVAICVANAWCALGAGTVQLASARVLTGLGEGSLMAAAGALAAGVANPHRLFSVLGFVIAAVAAAALVLTPVLFEHLGVRGVFWLLSVSPVAVLLAAPWLPRTAAQATDLPKFGAFAIPGARAVLIAFALLWVGASALWVFAERIGTAQGLSLAEVGRYLALGQVAGVLGPILAARFGERLGLQWSLAAGSAVMAAGGLWMVYGRTDASYIAGVSLLSVAVMFLTPCFRSLMARLDAAGAVVAISVAFYTFGFGVAPLLVGWLEAAGGSYGEVAWLAALAFTVSGSLAFTVRNPAGSHTKASG